MPRQYRRIAEAVIGALIRFALLVSLVSALPARARDSSRWQPYVAEASLRFGLPDAWIWRVMAIESRGRTMLDGRPIGLPKGAMG